MQILIDITEDNFREVQDGRCAVSTMRDAIKKGTPLPKGHGRLIDADEAIKTLKSLGSRDYRREKGTIQEAEKMLSHDDYTSTIVEADEEVENDT